MNLYTTIQLKSFRLSIFNLPNNRWSESSDRVYILKQSFVVQHKINHRFVFLSFPFIVPLKSRSFMLFLILKEGVHNTITAHAFRSKICNAITWSILLFNTKWLSFIFNFTSIFSKWLFKSPIMTILKWYNIIFCNSRCKSYLSPLLSTPEQGLC